MVRQCSYTHDVDGDRFDDLRSATWACPHPAPDGDRCPFHGDRSDGLGDLLLERIEDDDPEHNRFLGASFGDLSLDNAIVRGETNHPVDLRETSVAGDVSCANAVFSQSILLHGSRIEGTVNVAESTFGGRVMLVDGEVGRLECEEVTFERRFDLGNARVDEGANFRLVRFGSWADMREAAFEGPSYFRNARFTRGLYAVEATFSVAPDFLNATFDKVGNFKRATFRNGVNFGSAELRGSLDFRGAELLGTIDFQASQATGEIASKRAAFEGVGWFEGMVVGKELRFQDASIHGDLRLVDAVVSGSLVLDPDADRSTGVDVLVDLRGSEVAGGRLARPRSGQWTYDLASATVGEVRFTGPGDPFAVIRIRNTTFDGFDFGAPVHRESLSRNDWTLVPDDADVTNATIENTYLKAKNGASQVGASKAAAEFFRRQMTARRYGHWELFTDDDRSPSDRLLAGLRWGANAVLAASAGYGERPSYVVVISGGVVAAFTGLYAGRLGWGGSLGQLLEYLLFSFQSFITFILGSPPASGDFVIRIASAVEGFVGAFLIALFVFTLSRSIHR